MGLDMGLTENDAAIIQDELGDRGAAVGTPAHLGGVAYDELGVTGYGVAEAADAAASSICPPMVGARVSIQGFGAVGAATAQRLTELGAAVVVVSTARGGLYAADRFNMDHLLAARAVYGDELVQHEDLGVRTPPGQELTIDCDILVPAALQDTIDDEVAHQIKARLVVEGANLPTSPSAQGILAERDITVVPDFLANAGGVVAAAYAMDSRYSGFRPDTEAIFKTISTRLRANTHEVLDEARRGQTTPHTAGRAIAQGRVLAAMQSKGRLPRP